MSASTTSTTTKVSRDGVSLSRGSASGRPDPDTGVSLWTPEAKRNLYDRQEMISWACQLDSQVVKGRSWTFLMHMTFRNPIPRHHALTAGQHFRRWCSGWRWGSVGGKPIKAFHLLLWSAEEHQTGAVHLHALSVTTLGVSPKHCPRCQGRVSSQSTNWRKLKEAWFKHFGIARIFPYDPKYQFGAERYVTKYVLDESCLDWGVEQFDDE